MRHREDGPAIERSYMKSWYLNGVEYTEEEYNNGYKEWWINGKKLTEQEFKEYIVKKNLNEKLQFTFKPKYKEKKNKV